MARTRVQVSDSSNPQSAIRSNRRSAIRQYDPIWRQTLSLLVAIRFEFNELAGRSMTVGSNEEQG